MWQWELARIAAERSGRGFVLVFDEIQKFASRSESVKGLCGPASRPAPPRGPAGIGSPAPAAGNERESGRPIRNDPPHALVVRRDVRGIRRRPSKRFMQIAVEEARANASEGNAAVGSVVVRDENLIARGRNLVPPHRRSSSR